MTSDELKITSVERGTALWHKLQEHFTLQLNQLRMQNDEETLSETATALLRGRIKQVKLFLSMDKDAPQFHNDENSGAFRDV